ncbi:hypothetical protein A4X03_0g5061, partial [Tilletia caries]
ASLSWPLHNLSDHILAAAPNGGYLALYRDRSRLAALSHAQPSHLLRPNIQVYTPAGRLIETLPCDPTRKIIALGWTPAEQLAVVLDDGSVRIYTLFAAAPQFTAANGTGTGGPLGGPGASTSAAAATSSSSANPTGSVPVSVTSTCYYVPYSLGQEAADTGIADAQIYNPAPTAFVSLLAHRRTSLGSLDEPAPSPPDINNASGAGIVALTGAGTFLYWPSRGTRSTLPNRHIRERERSPLNRTRAVSTPSILTMVGTPVTVKRKRPRDRWCICYVAPNPSSRLHSPPGPSSPPRPRPSPQHPQAHDHPRRS